MRNSCLSRICKTKGDLIQNQLDTNKSDSKKCWKNIYEIIPKNKNNKNNIKLINHENSQPISEQDTALFINEFFSNIGPNLAMNFNQEWQYEGLTVDTHHVYITTNSEEFTKIYKEINSSEAACICNLSRTLLKLGCSFGIRCVK